MDFQSEVLSLMNSLTGWLPIGYSYAAGMVAAVNPCGLAMLPAYFSLYLGGNKLSQRNSNLKRFFRALWITGSVSAGFLVLFGIAGSFFSILGQFLIPVIPWFSVFIGLSLLLIGIWILSGYHLSSPLMARLTSWCGDPGNISTRGFFLFGLAYGITSLTCSLPIFLLVVGNAMAAGNFVGGIIQFISYSLGMGSIILVLTLTMALFKESLIIGKFQKGLYYVQRYSALLIMASGAYIIYYVISNGGILG